MGPATPEVQDALGLKLRYHDGGLEGPAQIKPIINAALAVATGQARHVLSYRTVMMLGGGGGSRGPGRIGGSAQWTLPFGAYAATNWIAWYGQRFMHERGMTREQLAWIALTQRQNAGHNPLAIYRAPMTMDDYMNVRMVSTPLCLYDCDVPVNGSIAIVISHKDYAEDTPKPACNIEAISAAISARPSWDQWERMALWDCAANLWTRTDLKPADVDLAELYDGFSTITLEWLEALGLCPPREVGNFILGGNNISLDGVMPLNTGGGMLSAGRLHGFIILHEAVVQLRGEGGGRQVPGNPEVAVVAMGGGPLAGSMLLTRHR
jgi:acetyl-CoA acetyltransferase